MRGVPGGSVNAAPAAGVDPLEMIDSWGASFAAAGAAGTDGRVHRHGDTGHTVRVASITKLLTAWAVLVAVEEGSVGLEEPAGPPGATVRHLLCHAAGLDFDGTTVLAPPGQRRIYSNGGYEVLARHVTSATAIPFATYLHDAVSAPLGLRSTELRGDAGDSLWTNVDDLLAFSAELVAPRLLHPDTVADALRPQFPDLAGVVPGWGSFDPCPWGLGPELRGGKDPHWTGSTAAPSTFGHFGGSGTMLWVDPEARVHCVALCDRAFGDWAVAAWPPFSDAVRAAYR
jgi:CubicO group peptidase (beta-lactamase class C family)